MQLVWEDRLEGTELVKGSKANNLWIYYIDIHISFIVYLLDGDFFPFQWISTYKEKSVSAMTTKKQM